MSQLGQIETETRRAAIAAAEPAPRVPETSQSHASFTSILFATPEDRVEQSEAPDFFRDLHCDQIVEAITAGREAYDLKPFFYATLRRADAIRYRQTVMHDLERSDIAYAIGAFTQKMQAMRAHLERHKKAYYAEQKQAWFLEAAETYCTSVAALADGLLRAVPRSHGLQAFCGYLQSYLASPRFRALAAEIRQLKSMLAKVRYCVRLKGTSVTVQPCESEVDYAAEIEQIFARFRQGAVEDYRAKFPSDHDMNHVEAKILEFVAKLHPATFAALDGFCRRNVHFGDDTIATFEREIQFYVAYLAYIAPIRAAGLSFCYPVIAEDKHVFDQDGFDLALAHKRVAEKGAIVTNSFELSGFERILVVSGPNQGGKTTFARTFGQVHYLASLGCLVPGSEARLFLFDQIFTHFEREERVENLRGKLEDDLIRIRGMLAKATPRSIIVMNEIFTSTAIQDEIFLSQKIIRKIAALDLLCVWVTFVDELASFGRETVSMVSTVLPENPAMRTFKIVRRPADGLAYAAAIARKYGLTREAIEQRIGT